MAKVAYDNEDDAAAVRDKMDGAMGDVTTALDDSEKVKVKSDKSTLKDVEAHAKELKAIEKREKALRDTAKTELLAVEEDRNSKDQALTNADTGLKTKLKEGKQEATE